MEHSLEENLASLVPRAYQYEMLEESLQQNTIVVMSTGTGKTQVAILRIQAELERSQKLIWFLAPTVSLCQQQHEVLSRQIPHVETLCISGNDNVDSWSSLETWNALLVNVQVVVTTFQILLDALTHAFVSISDISLLVIDEAHNCVGNHPGSKIMLDFYHPARLRGTAPHILGLTASPSMSAKTEEFEMLEAKLHSILRSPQKHVDELLACTNRPKIEFLRYNIDGITIEPHNTSRVRQVYLNLDISEDPYVRYLMKQKGDRYKHRLESTILSRKTYVQQQIRSLSRKSIELLGNVGLWAAEYFLHTTITQYLKQSNSGNDFWYEGWQDTEKKYLTSLLAKLDLKQPNRELLSRTEAITNKTRLLLDVLYERSAKAVSTIVFVQERATASVLARIIKEHPFTRNIYQVGIVLGVSTHVYRNRDISELGLGLRTFEQSLEDFRSGKLNLLVATSALEEGIDIPNCNLIICYDTLTSYKAFVQRRGRARARDSSLVLMIDEFFKLQDWHSFEKTLEASFEDEQRKIRRLQEVEQHEFETATECLLVPSTGAKLDLNSAKSHLYHFCQTLCQHEFADSRPTFIVQRLKTSEPPLYRARAILPSSLPESVRNISSKRSWASERNAIKDASFQVYRKLFDEKLVNDHLLPFKPEEILQLEVEPRDSFAFTYPLVSAWDYIAERWRSSDLNFDYTITIDYQSGITQTYTMTLPIELHIGNPIPIFLSQTPVYIHIGSPQRRQHSQVNRDQSHLLLHISLPTLPIDSSKRSIVCVSSNEDLCLEDMGAVAIGGIDNVNVGDIIRYSDNIPFYVLEKFATKPTGDEVPPPLVGLPEELPDDGPYVIVRKATRRRDYLHPITETDDYLLKRQKLRRLAPLSWFARDRFEKSHTLFGQLLPSLWYEIKCETIAHMLQHGKLASVDIQDSSLVRTAITARSAAERMNYERFEFLGDSILKFYTSIYLASEHLHWPEGYLTSAKDRIVSNSRLSACSIVTKLSSYIILEHNRGSKPKPIYMDDYIHVESLEEGKETVSDDPSIVDPSCTKPQNQPEGLTAKAITGTPSLAATSSQKPIAPPKITSGEDLGRTEETATTDGITDDPNTRRISTKTMADVCESLIGVSFYEGGFEKALKCISNIIEDLSWRHIEDCRRIIFSQAVSDELMPPALEPMEKLIGYTFKCKAIMVEAMTHASFPSVKNINSKSLERLEFIGDSILDNIISLELFKINDGNLSHDDMHLLRTTLVNGDFLAFLAMEVTVETLRFNISSNNQLTEKSVPVSLWQFLRFSSPWLAENIASTKTRHQNLREDILKGLKTGERYPWALFAQLRARKFVSDLFESMLGAVWIDSGSLECCRQVVKRFGILDYMLRFIADNVKLTHPKQELGQRSLNDPVHYQIYEKTQDEVTPDSSKSYKTYSCKVYIATNLWGTCGEAMSIEESKVLAANDAICRMDAGLPPLETEVDGLPQDTLSQTTSTVERAS